MSFQRIAPAEEDLGILDTADGNVSEALASAHRTPAAVQAMAKLQASVVAHFANLAVDPEAVEQACCPDVDRVHHIAVAVFRFPVRYLALSSAVPALPAGLVFGAVASLALLAAQALFAVLRLPVAVCVLLH